VGDLESLFIGNCCHAGSVTYDKQTYFGKCKEFYGKQTQFGKCKEFYGKQTQFGKCRFLNLQFVGVKDVVTE
jgi:hypothetical protein